MSTVATTAAPPRTVADALLRQPTVHRADLTVGQARAAFDASAKTHMLLLAGDGVLIGTLTRADLDRGGDGGVGLDGGVDLDPNARAAAVGTLVGRTTAPDVPLAPTHALMCRRGIRRLAVVDDAMRLLGLLCLKHSRSGFCTDDGVAAMRRARAVGRG